MTLSLASPVPAIDGRIAARSMGVGPRKGPPAAVVLREGLGIATVHDLLGHYPRAYIDRSQVGTIRGLRVGDAATVIGRVTEVKERTPRTRKQRRPMVTLTVYDGTGFIDVTFFNQPWRAKQYRKGMELAVSGTIARYGRRLQVQNHEVEILRGDDADTVHTARITPIHPATEGVAPRTIRELIWRALEQLPTIPDPLPARILEAEGLPPYDGAVRAIHFPDSQEELAAARDRLKFDELFTLQLGVALRKARLEQGTTGTAHASAGPLIERLHAALPFEPTRAQRRAFERVSAAMARPHPMNLLLQGDVGAGKTVVAVHAAIVAIQSGHQAAVMAPTEVLASQHLRSIASLVGPIGAAPFEAASREGRRSGDERAPQPSLFQDAPREGAGGGGASRAAGGDGPPLTYAMLSAAVTGSQRQEVLRGIADGRVDLVVGTHALVQEGVSFRDLSLAVVDEQHRFGVHQRMALRRKARAPDVLIMTATPIPRTLALTYYGDLDVVVLNEMPLGRRPVETRVVRSGAERSAAYRVVRREIESGRQAFVVCAAIDEDNGSQVRAAEREAERLAKEIFPDLRVDMLHGRMRPLEKERRMDEFRGGRSQLLISTTVVEVGVDVPNATVMVVENAERFGLAQLHQLRGRIGRAGHRSFCFLVDGGAGESDGARARLDALARTADGFELADEDLRLRGEGTLFDARQSGMPDLRLARLAEDLELVKRARARAFEVIEEDPRLERHPTLMAQLRSSFGRAIEWLFGS